MSLALLSAVVIEFSNQLDQSYHLFMFSSPVLRGSYRIDSSLKPITSIVQRQNLLSKIATNHLYYKCRMSHFLTTKFQLYSSYIILYFPMPKLVFIPDPENSPNFNKK